MMTVEEGPPTAHTFENITETRELRTLWLTVS